MLFCCKKTRKPDSPPWNILSESILPCPFCLYSWLYDKKLPSVDGRSDFWPNSGMAFITVITANIQWSLFHRDKVALFQNHGIFVVVNILYLSNRTKSTKMAFCLFFCHLIENWCIRFDVFIFKQQLQSFKCNVYQTPWCTVH